MRGPVGKVLRFDRGFLLCERMEVQDRFDNHVDVEIRFTGRFARDAYDRFLDSFRPATNENVTIPELPERKDASPASDR